MSKKQKDANNTVTDKPLKEEKSKTVKNSEELAKEKDLKANSEEKNKDDVKKEDPSAKVAELEAKCTEWQNQYLRKSADFDNYRKRMLKEKQEAINYANSNLLLDLVQVLDDFDRAIEAGTGKNLDKADSVFAEGIIMIKNQMLSMLKSKYGLEQYDAKGAPFDPNLHEAISMIPSTEVKEQTVGEEILKGYKLRDRIIRHAKVMVFMPKEEKIENKDDDGAGDNNDEKTAKKDVLADKENK